VARQRRQSGS
jgi:hypothetical protein